MLVCGTLISCGIRQIYGFPGTTNEPTQKEFDDIINSYPHKATWTIASLTTSQAASIEFLKRNGFVQFDTNKPNMRTANGNQIVFLIRAEEQK